MGKENAEEQSGAYYAAGTRVSLDSIVECFNEGMSAESILAEFDTLTLAQIYGAIAYYLDNQSGNRRMSDSPGKKVPSHADLRQLQARNSSLVTRFVRV